MRHAVIDKNTHKVKQVIIWDGVSKWSPPDNHYVVKCEAADTGDTYNHEKKEFIKFHNNGVCK